MCWISPFHAEQPDLPVPRVKQGQPELLELPEPLAPLALPVLQVPLALLALPALPALLALLAQKVLPDPLVPQVPPDQS